MEDQDIVIFTTPQLLSMLSAEQGHFVLPKGKVLLPWWKSVSVCVSDGDLGSIFKMTALMLEWGIPQVHHPLNEEVSV